MRTLIAGGGTGGHLTPALALAQGLKSKDPSNQVMLVVRKGTIDARLSGNAGFPVAYLSVRGVDVSRPTTVASALVRLPASWWRALRIIRKFRADVVVGTAGYVCVPVILAAITLRIPYVLLEQNVMPGRAVRLLSKRARAVAVTYEQTKSYLPGAKVEVTGNPVREEFLQESPAKRDHLEHILVTGGSQGARVINRAVAGCVERLLVGHPGLSITHQCGSLDIEEMRAAKISLEQELRQRYLVEPFFDDMSARVADSDLVVMRAGASSLAEVSLLGRPMIIIPYPYAGAHQEQNAKPYVKGGAALLLANSECDAGHLFSLITNLVGDSARWRQMAAASITLSKPEATDNVVRLLAGVRR